VNVVDLILLALAAAVYPTLLAGVILILSRPSPLRLLIGFYVGGMTISIIAGCAIVKAIESSKAVSKSNQSGKPIVDIVVGAASLVLASGIWSGHVNRGFRQHKRTEPDLRATEGSSWTSRVLSRGSLTAAFIAGVALNLPGIWYLDALTGIAKAKPSHPSALLQILLFNLIMFTLVEVPIIAYLINPRRATGLVTRFSDWGHSHARTIAVVVATAVGLWLLVKGIVELVS